MTADPNMEIVDYDRRWPSHFLGERDRVRIGLGIFHMRYEHVGATAVPGQRARPVVDLMLGAPPASWAALPDVRARLVALGYEDLGDAAAPGRFVFRRRTLRAFDIALVELDGPEWKATLAERDRLRAG